MFAPSGWTGALRVSTVDWAIAGCVEAASNSAISKGRSKVEVTRGLLAHVITLGFRIGSFFL
jgi:hypothetical protein